MVISNDAVPLGGGSGANGTEALKQNSFERFTNDYHQMPGPAGRSPSHEETLVAMALLGCAAKRPPSRSSGERVDSGAWGDMLALGGENVQGLALGGRKHPDGDANVGSGASINDDPKAQRQRQEQEERQQLLEMEELANSMPTMPPFSMPPFSDGASSRSSSNNSRSSSRKGRILSRKLDSATIWTGASTDSALLDLFTYKRSSGSGSSGGGGPQGDEGGRGATENAGGGRSNGNSGGGASWEGDPYSGALSSSAGAGGATTTHDDVMTSNSCTTSSSKFNFGQHPLRQQSFQPDREISGLPSAKDFCPDQPVPGPGTTAACVGVRDWEKAAAVSTITTTITTSRSAEASVTTSSSDLFVARDRENLSVAASACHPNPHSHHNHINTDGPIAPAPAPRPEVQPLAPRPPGKPSFNLLAMMIPDISKLGKPPTAAPFHAPGVVPGAAPGGVGFPAGRGFARATAVHFSAADSYRRVGVEDGEKWTREAALARYRHKKKRRHLVKMLRELDPTLQEQNEARKRPRKGGKFKKERPDFVSICEVQRAAKSRSSSGELPLRERESATPPPQPSARRGAAPGRAARAKS